VNSVDIKTDVLVIGGGAAGVRAAIEADEQGADVLLVCKGILGRSGCSPSATHVSAVAAWGVPDDDPMVGFDDIVRAGEGLGNPELIRILVAEGAEAMRDLERFGVLWQRSRGDKVDVYLVGGHSAPRTVTFLGDRGGSMVISTLVKELRRREIRTLQDVIMFNLLRDEGRVSGCLGYDYVSGRIIVVEAGSVIMATGGYSQIYSPTTVAREDTGDGQVMALDAGATLIDMEATIFLPAGVPYGGDVNIPVKFGASQDTPHLLNTQGERFMKRYNPVDLEFGTKETLLKGIVSEVKAGRGTERGGVYVDLRHLPWDDPAVNAFYGVVRELGAPYKIDPRTDLIEVVPIAHTSIGGIRVNERCESDVKNLYACGSVAGGIYGFARIEGFTMAITQVFGKRAGRYAAWNSRDAGRGKIHQEDIDAAKARVKALLASQGGLSPTQGKALLRDIMSKHAWVLKTEEGLKKAVDLIEALSSRSVGLTSSTLSFNYELVEALEFRNMIEVARTVLMGSLMRKESRGAFMRSDYPSKDDKNWRRHILYRRTPDGRIEAIAEGELLAKAA